MPAQRGAILWNAATEPTWVGEPLVKGYGAICTMANPTDQRKNATLNQLCECQHHFLVLRSEPQ